MTQKEAALAESLRSQWSARMTEDEIAFLRDLAGFIDFATRNGLIFPMTVATLLHDLNEVARSGFDLGVARSHGFKPKVEGYSKLTPDAFATIGEEDEDEDVPPS